MNKGIVYFVGFALIASLIFMSVAYVSVKRENKEMTAAVKLNSYDSTSWYKDKAGREHAQTQEEVMDLNTTLLLKGKLFDSVCKALKIKPKEINTITTFTTETNGDVVFVTDTIYIDSTHKTVGIKYSDKWIKIEGNLENDKLNYDVFDSLIITQYNKKYGFLNLRSSQYLDAYSLNPHTHIKGLTGIKIADQKPKKVSLGIGIGYGFNGQKLEPMIGISLQYSLIRF